MSPLLFQLLMCKATQQESREAGASLSRMLPFHLARSFCPSWYAESPEWEVICLEVKGVHALVLLRDKQMGLEEGNYLLKDLQLRLWKSSEQTLDLPRLNWISFSPSQCSV